MASLEEYKKLAVDQAERKGWNNTDWWLKKKFKEEVKEFLRAFKDKDPRQLVKEFSDVLIVGFQITNNGALKHDLDEAYVNKLADNDKHKKKTWDNKKKKIIRK